LSPGSSNQSLVLGTNQGQQILLTLPQHVQGTNSLQMIVPPASVPGTNPRSLLTTQVLQGASQIPIQQQGNQSTEKGNNSGNSKSYTEKGDNSESKKLIFNLTPSSLPPEEQLKKFISSKQAPRDREYYIIANKGLPSEMTFFIEPKKKGKRKPKDTQDTGKKKKLNFY